MIYTITLNPAIDRLLFLDKPLTKRKTNRVTKVTYDVGGKGTHGSYAMSRLAVSNQALGFAGTDNFLKFEQVLTEKHINHAFLKVSGCTRESLVVIEPDNEGSTMLTEPGFIVPKERKKELLEMLNKKLTSQDYVLIAGSLPANYELADLEELMRTVKGKGCFLACDLSGAALERAVESGVDFIKPNEYELAELIAKSSVSEEQALKQLAEKVTCIVTSKGAQGSICYFDGKKYTVVAPKVEEVNDTGAGDCFVGSFLAEFSKERCIEASLKIGSACAASKVQYEDSSYFDPKEAMELAEKVKVVCRS